MSEKMVISVDGPDSAPDHVTVQDAFKHVIELFELATKSTSDPENAVIWRLVSVSMNSPLTVTAEAVSAKAGVDITIIARAQKEEFASNLNSLKRGVIPNTWKGESTIKIAKDFLNRNRKGIGNTKIDFGVNQPLQKIEITHADSEFAEMEIGVIATELKTKPTKTQIGSIEGCIIDVSTHYKQPAILIRERKTNAKIWCIVNDSFRREIVGKTTFDDVWGNKRVSITGEIEYDKERKISRVIAKNIKHINGEFVSTESIVDPEFTSGLSAVDYLEKLREGALG